MELLEFKDTKCTPDIINPYTSSIKSNAVPIVIDNGNKNFNTHSIEVYLSKKVFLQALIWLELVGLLVKNHYCHSKI